MKNKQISDSWNNIEPDCAAKERMFNNIIDRIRETQKRKVFNMKLFASIAACALIMLTIAIPSFLRNNLPNDINGNDLHFAYVYDYLDIFFVTEQDVITSESVFLRFAPVDIFSTWAGMNSVSGVSLIDSLFDRDFTEIYHSDPSDPNTAVSVELGDYTVLNLTVSEEFAAFVGGGRGQLLVEALKKTFYHYIGFDDFHLTIGVIDRELPKAVSVYIADEGSSAMVILLENSDFALQGSEYISFIPTGRYRIENGKLILSMGDDDIIFIMKGDRLIFESGAWLEDWVEIGTVFELTDE